MQNTHIKKQDFPDNGSYGQKLSEIKKLGATCIVHSLPCGQNNFEAAAELFETVQMLH